MDKEVKLALIGLLMSFVTAAKDIVVAYINNDTDTQDKQQPHCTRSFTVCFKYMNKIESNYFRDALNDNIEVFKNSIYDCFKIGANNIINNPINNNPFEIFNIDNIELNKYKKLKTIYIL